MPIKIDTEYVKQLEEVLAEQRKKDAPPQVILSILKLLDKARQRNHERILIRNTRGHATKLRNRAKKALQEKGPIPTLADIAGEAMQTKTEET